MKALDITMKALCQVYLPNCESVAAIWNSYWLIIDILHCVISSVEMPSLHFSGTFEGPAEDFCG
jgi:hypothetical protein